MTADAEAAEDDVDAVLALPIAEAVARAARHTARGRWMLGITGAPGAGKSTLSDALAAGIPGSVIVSMDGFHFANAVLHDRGTRDRKGAPHTFDVHGLVDLLLRIRHQRPDDPSVFAPRFDRALDESIGSAVEVPADASLIIVEGNYLLHDRDGWERIATLLDETWFVDPGDQLRQERLIRRHEEFGLSPQAATAWALGTDELNARVVHETRGHADLLLTLTDRLPADTDDTEGGAA